MQDGQEVVQAAAQRIVADSSSWSPVWTVVVELCVHVQARAFGFQVVNASQEGTQQHQCTPATSAVAADHLVHLLKDRAAVVAAEVKGRLDVHADHVLQESIASLHAAYFAQGPYQSWKAKSLVKVLDRELSKFIHSRSLKVNRSAAVAPGREDGATTAAASGLTGVSDAPDWVLQLSQLALYFCLWTEAANLRHTPELLWLIYHMMLSSNNFNKACAVLGSTDLSHYSLQRWLLPTSANGRSSNRSSVGSMPGTNPQAPSVPLAQLASSELKDLQDDLVCYEGVRRLGFVRGVLLPVRNALGNAARVGALLEDGPGPYNNREAAQSGARVLQEGPWWSGFPDNELAARQVLGLNTIKAQPGVPPGIGIPADAWPLAQLVLEDIMYFGDGCIFLDMVVQPVFNLMAEQISLMGDVGDSPALRLGYDDFNESACMPQVLSALVRDLSGENFVDPWDGLLRRFLTCHAAVEAVWRQSSYSDHAFKPATPDMQQRYPRDPRRLDELAAKLRDAGAGGAKGNAVLEQQWGQLQQQLQTQGQAARGDGDSEWVRPSTGGSMPVVHLHASLRVADSLWAKLFKKSFIETRSLGAVLVAFSRVYVLHAILLCWMTLMAYRVPEVSLSGSTSIFTGAFWQSHGLIVADCISWGVFLHAVLHVVKDVLLIYLLATPSAVRYRLEGREAIEPAPPVGVTARMRLWSARQWKSKRPDNSLEQVVQPPVHGGGMLKVHNIATLLFWLACCVVLLDSHVPSWPLNKVLTKALTKKGASGPTMPVWGLMALVYVGLWVLHWVSGAVADALPGSFSRLLSVARKDSRRAAEHYFPYGAMSASQNWPRFLVNSLLWGLVLLVKILFDFFVVLQPLATGAARKLLLPLDSSTPWTRWTEAILAVWSLWVAAAFLVFYDTGLFWQLISAVYSTLFLGMRRRIGHVKTWYDLVWAFPRLSYMFNQRMIPSIEPETVAKDGQPRAISPVQVDVAAAADTVAGGAAPAATTATTNTITSAPVKALAYVAHSPVSEVVFHLAWDQIVTDLRLRDLLSDAEAGSLKYTHLSWGRNRETAWLLLPRFVAAGAAAEAISQRGLTSKTQIQVIIRSFNWLVWLLAGLNMLTEGEVKALVLASSSKQAGPGGTGPREASTDDVMRAAGALVKSKELLGALKKKLANAAVPFCPLGVGEDNGKRDVNTQLLLEEALKAVLPLSRPKLDKDASTAILLRPQRINLTDPSADPCSEAFWLQYRQSQCAQAQEQVRAADGQPTEVYVAAQQALDKAQEELAKEVTDARRNRRQLLTQVVGWLLDMLEQTRGEAVPKSAEAVRALTFFATSLSNPKMPSAQPVGLTRSMTTLTPHYGEAVLYALSKQAANTEMGTKCTGGGDDVVLLNDQEEPTETLNYLRIVYAKDWRNFQQRLFGMPGVKEALQQHNKLDKPTPTNIKEAAFLPGQPLNPWCHELLTWASMRGQLLQRTVHGMMYYETALQQLILMQCRPQLTAMARQVMEAAPSSTLRKEYTTDGWADQVAEAAALLLAREKYSYVVSSQVLGEMQLGSKVAQRWLAHSIRAVLSSRYPSLRVAYIDLENLGDLQPAAATAGAAAAAARPGQAIMAGPRNRGRGGKAHRLLRQYSVLLQYDARQKTVVEAYRVRLPMNLETDRGVILGEGKPENQNHAIIFCHTETVQTVDSNQDNFLVEALKLPNLLAEFEYQDGHRINVRGSLNHQQKSSGSLWSRLTRPSQVQGPALVGFREWVFSEDSGALAEFAAATERSFGTTVQRIMHNPGGCRFHYGHPDVWDKLFTMTNGGVSKSTKSLHVSEDVFGGYNVMLRGRDVGYVDYIAVGKGRDMGFETINVFEAKIAAGNGEQVVSRDVSRLARRMNLPRLLSWYFTGNGFFINMALLMYSMLVNAWLCLLLVLLSGVSGVNTSVLDESLAVVGGLQLLQLGSLSVLVYIATVWLEDGFFTTIKNVLKQFVAGSIFFYVFRGQTSATAFMSDLTYGGATYAATGRGYKLKATPFIEVFMRYGRTHMWFGAHLLVLLVVAVALGLKASLLLAWANILAILSLLAAPFWFNPFSLDWQTNKAAAKDFLDWMAGNKPGGSGDGKKLWRQYNEEQLQKATDDKQLQLGRTGNNMLALLLVLPSVIVICVAVYGMLGPWWGGIIVIGAVNAILAAGTACWYMADHLEAVKDAAVLSRSVKFVLKFVLAVGAILLFVFMIDPATGKKINLFRIVVRVLMIEFELARLTGRLLIGFVPRWQPARRIINHMCWVADFALGLVLLLLLFIGSLFGLLTRYQASVLFSMGYAAYYLAEEGLKHSEVGRLAKELKELQRQERSVERAAAAGGSDSQPPAGGASPGDTPRVVEALAAAPQHQQHPLNTASSPRSPTRSTGLEQHVNAGGIAESAQTPGPAADSMLRPQTTAHSSPAPSRAASGLPSLSTVTAFLRGQQQQQVVSSSAASNPDSTPAAPAPAGPPSSQGVAASEPSAANSSISSHVSLEAASSRSPLPPAVSEEASLVSSPAARGAPPSEDELQRWRAAAESERLRRVFERSDTMWSEPDAAADDIDSGGLPEDLVREASAAGAAAAAAARTGSSGSTAAPAEASAGPPASGL